MSELAVQEVPGLLDQAERALAAVNEPRGAEDLFRKLAAVEQAAQLTRAHGDLQLRVGKLRLRAERRWGQLLGEAQVGRPSGNVTAGNDSGRNRVAQHRARLVAAVAADVFDRYLAGVRDPELLRRARLLRVAREDAADRRRAEPIEPVAKLGDIKTRHGDFRDVLADLVGVPDAVITDPPYQQQDLHLYGPLAETAAFLLRPGGSLVVLCGTRPDAWLRVLPAMEAHLPLRWVGCYLTQGASWRDHQARVSTNWKPVLVFGDGPNLTTDVWRSSPLGDEKDAHRWGQNADAFAQLVRAFTKPGGLVVDPFLGGGTTAVVCRDLGRRFVGCDTDAAAVAATRERLAA